MSKHKVHLVLIVAWMVVVVVAVYAMREIFDERIRGHWFLVASMFLCALALLVLFLRWVYRLALPLERHPSSAGVATENNIVLAKGGLPMPENKNSDNRVLHINHGPSYYNTPGGMMNLGPVTVHQNIVTPQGAPEPAQDEPKETTAEVIGDAETIDINSLVDFSERLKSPGVARNTIDNILKKAGIKPCATEKDGRNIRNLYPRKESQAAVASYLADKGK